MVCVIYNKSVLTKEIFVKFSHFFPEKEVPCLKKKLKYSILLAEIKNK